MNEGQTYAALWFDAWNSRELIRALALWAEDMEFCSPLAFEITGSAVLKGKTAVASYWAAALAQAGELHFEPIEVLWDANLRTVAIVYRRSRMGQVRIAAEIIRLNAQGLGEHGMALHGAVLDCCSSVFDHARAV